MSESEWREAIKFDSTDTGWVIMSIGMAIGAGIVFLPVQVGLMGLWVFALVDYWLSGHVFIPAPVY
jgi:amino acid permease